MSRERGESGRPQVLLAGALPAVHMIAVLPEIWAVVEHLSVEVKTFFRAYVFLVWAFDIWGRIALIRFFSYLFIPGDILMAPLVQRQMAVAIAAMLIAVFVFDPVWLPPPMSDAGIIWTSTGVTELAFGGPVHSG